MLMLLSLRLGITVRKIIFGRSLKGAEIYIKRFSSGVATPKLLSVMLVAVLSIFTNSPAHAVPNSPVSISEQSRVQIEQLDGGKTRVQVTLSKRLAGKTVTIRSARLIDGIQWTAVIGRAKVKPSGKAVFTTSRIIRVEDRMTVSNRKRNVLSEVVTLIGRPSVDSAPSKDAAGGSLGSGVSSPQAPRQSAEAAARQFIDGGGDPMSAAYLNLINHIENGGTTGDLDNLLQNIEVTLRCGTGGTCPEKGTPIP